VSDKDYPKLIYGLSYMQQSKTDQIMPVAQKTREDGHYPLLIFIKGILLHLNN
jgi:hypothetical protein